MFMGLRNISMQKYRNFNNVDEAKTWGKRYYSYWLPRYQMNGVLRLNYDTEHPEKFLNEVFAENELDKMKLEAFEYKWFSYYCGGNWGKAINQILRYGYSTYEFNKKDLVDMQKTMDSRLNKSYIPENIVGYRFLNYKDLCKSVKKSNIKLGMILEDKGYMGIGLVKKTLQNEFGNYDTVLKIMIPKGVNGLYLDLISNRKEEQEVLFSRGTKIKVLFIFRGLKKE